MNDFVKKAASKISKLSDEQVESLIEILTAENETLNSALESLSTGLILVNSHFQILRINSACQRYLPFKTVNDTDSIWNLIDDNYISDYLFELKQKKSTNASEEFTVFSGEKNRFITLTVVPLVNTSTLKGGSIITVDDITEKRQQEILLHRMESLAGLTNLAASVAHEIKNPLGAISIHIQLLQKAIKKARSKDNVLPEEKYLENYLNVVNEEIDNLNKIVMDFLFAVRPVQADLKLVDPDVILEKIVNFLKPEFESKKIKISCDLKNNGNRVLIDEKLFREIIVNLAQNSLYAIEEKFRNVENSDEEKKFYIKSYIKNEKYHIVVEDNGCGMEEETAARIFEPYYTTKAQGTGLGLTMVYKIIKEFRGDINVSSVKNEGTCFSIVLPLPQPDTKLLATH